MTYARKRVVTLFLITAVALTALCGRLYYIQIVCGDALAAGAQGQQAIQVYSQDRRGVIYDRNMIPLTDSCQCYYYLIEKSRIDQDFQQLMERTGGCQAGSMGEKYVVYKLERFSRILNQRLVSEYGAYAFCCGTRYDDRQTAAHLIGYTDADGVGQSGLEKLYQYRLSAAPAALSLTGNGAGQPVLGLGLSQSQGEGASLQPSSLVTTIDKALQEKVEEILHEKNITGAAVVLDTATGQVLAMASTPAFDPNQLDGYLSSDQGELMNKAIQGQYPPGSVFKIAVAAAALESGLADQEFTFTCTGSVQVNGVKMVCEGKEKGHGKLNMEQAFACSCNCYFAKLAEKVGAENILEMARRLGLGQQALDGFPGEEAGAFPAEEDCAYSGLANLAVGQGSLLVTPIQIAKMTNIIAAGGISHRTDVVMSQESSEDEGTRTVTAKTAAAVAEMMKEVCLTGTGSGNQAHVSIAGKTGSAEAGGDVVHGWFTGFFPAEHPRFTVTVFAEDGKTGSGSALPVFEEIVNWLY